MRSVHFSDRPFLSQEDILSSMSDAQKAQLTKLREALTA